MQKVMRLLRSAVRCTSCEFWSKYFLAAYFDRNYSWRKPYIDHAWCIAVFLTVIFQLVTLPVEFNASSRALKILGNSHILYDDEISGARKVLTAAALTYVAAAASSILQLLRLLLLFGDRRDD